MHPMKRKRHNGQKFNLKVGRSRTGRGLFALETIKRGLRIVEYTGRPLKSGEEYTSRSKFLRDLTHEDDRRRRPLECGPLHQSFLRAKLPSGEHRPPHLHRGQAGGSTGFPVGDTGSSRGATVSRRTGWLICAMTKLILLIYSRIHFTHTDRTGTRHRRDWHRWRSALPRFSRAFY